MSNLLGLPGEVRLLILQLLLAKNSGSSRAIDLTDSVVIKFGETLESKLSFPTSLEQFPQYSTLLPVNINVGSVQILQTCKQVSREGAFVLYSMHRFSAVQASAFRTRFIPSIGSFNSSCVKSVHLRAPPCSEHEPSVLFARFVHFLSCRMANLQNLSLSTNVYKYGDPQPALNGSSVWAREHSLMLWTAAWITLRHTQMKRAVWSEVSLNSYSPEPDREGSIMIFVRFTVPGTEWGKSLKGGIKDRCEEVGTSDHQHRPYEDFVLNSRAIRRRGWLGLCNSHDPMSYAILDVGASPSSELGQPQSSYEDLCARFAYRLANLEPNDGKPAVDWGDLRALHLLRLRSRIRSSRSFL